VVAAVRQGGVAGEAGRIVEAELVERRRGQAVVGRCSVLKRGLERVLRLGRWGSGEAAAEAGRLVGRRRSELVAGQSG
jgi:hypothetical protein